VEIKFHGLVTVANISRLPSTHAWLAQRWPQGACAQRGADLSRPPSDVATAAVIPHLVECLAYKDLVGLLPHAAG
jgi:hypothetical protein